jgi:uncharacterized membrane protein
MKWYQLFIKRIFSGIILFLLPVTLLIFILGKAVLYLRKVILPLKAYLPAERVFGIGLLTVISLVIVLLICYIAGILSEKKFVKSMISALEENLLVLIPGYAMIKSRASDAISETDQKWRAVLVKEKDDWRIGIEVDRKPGGHSTVFFPGPPDPRSGIIQLVHKSKIKHLTIPVSEVVKSVRKYGEGAPFWITDAGDQAESAIT